MSSKDSLAYLQTIYDRKYLEFVTQVLSSSRYYTNLRNHCENQDVYKEDRNEEPTVLYCRNNGEQESGTVENINDQTQGVGSELGKDCKFWDANTEGCVETQETGGLFNTDICSDSSWENYDEDSVNVNRSKLLNSNKKRNQKKKHRRKHNNSDFKSISCANFDLRGIVQSVLEVDIQKKPHTNIFKLNEDDLQELKTIYGSEADDVLKLEQNQELVFQKACEKITASLPNFAFP